MACRTWLIAAVAALLVLTIAVDCVSGEEAVVVDDTNVKHHQPMEAHEEDHKATDDGEDDDSGPVYEFIADPGLLLPVLSEEEETAALGRLVEWLTSESPNFAQISLDRKDGKSFLKAEGDYEGASLLATLPLCTMITTATPSQGMPEDTPYCDLSRRWEQALLVKCFTQPGGTASDEEKKKHFIEPSRGHKVLLALALLHELKKDGGSFYQPFLNIMPRTLSQPVVWSNEAIEELQASPLAGAIRLARQQLHDDYRVLSKHLFTHPAQGFTEQQFNWAILYVSSRMEELFLPSRARSVKALIPLMDFIEIDPIMGSILKLEDGSSLDEVDVSLVGFDYSAGEALRVRKLSCFTSQCLLLNYGLLPPENQYDHLPLVIVRDGVAAYQSIVTEYLDAESAAPEVFEAKATLLTQNGLSEVALGPGSLLTVMSAFRILAMTTTELAAAQSAIADGEILLAHAAQTISETNDARASTVLSEILFHSYMSYPTSLADDELRLEELAESNARDELIQAVTIRMREKKLLLHAIFELDAEDFPLFAAAKVLLNANQASAPKAAAEEEQEDVRDEE